MAGSSAQSGPSSPMPNPPPPPTTMQSSRIDPVLLLMPSILINSTKKMANSARAAPRHAVSSSDQRPLRPPLVSKERYIGKRKLLRCVNSALSVHNPHVVRPKATDYQPGAVSHARYHGTFPNPLPKYLREFGKGGEIKDGREAREWRREMELVSAPSVSTSPQPLRLGDHGLDPHCGHTGSQTHHSLPESGLFTMSLQEARFFLKRRAGVVSKLDQQRQRHAERRGQAAIQSHQDQDGRESHACRTISPEAAQGSAADTSMQRLVNCIEVEFDAWQRQVVYLAPSSDKWAGGNTTQLKDSPRTLLESENSSSSSSVLSGTARVEEHHHLPQSLSLLIPDAFDRLTVHCLARVWGLRSFSKPVAQTHTGSRRASDATRLHEAKLTWILKPSRSKVARAALSNLSGSFGRSNPYLVDPQGLGSTASDRFSSGRISLVNGHASSHGASPSQGAAVGFETPPTTDVGTSTSEQEESEPGDTDDTASSIAENSGEVTMHARKGSLLTALQEVGEEGPILGSLDESMHCCLLDLNIEGQEEGAEGYEQSGGEDEGLCHDEADDEVASSVGEEPRYLAVD